MTRSFRASLLLVLVPLAFLGGCELLGLDESGFESARVYEHFLFDSQAECDLVQAQNPVYNCSQWLYLCPGGGGEFVGTDIVNLVRYQRHGSLVTVRFREGGDYHGQLYFSRDGDDLTEHGRSVIWRRMRSMEADYQRDYCD